MPPYASLADLGKGCGDRQRVPVRGSGHRLLTLDEPRELHCLSWLKLLEDGPRAVLDSATPAERAVEFPGALRGMPGCPIRLPD